MSSCLRFSLLVVAILAGAAAEAAGPGPGPVSEAELRAVAAWVEAESGRRAGRPFPAVVWMSGHALDRLAPAPGTVHGTYDPEANVIRLRRGASRERTLAWSAHELAHWADLPGTCPRDAELFAYEMEGRWARAQGLRRLVPSPRQFARARSRPCLPDILEELRAVVGTPKAWPRR